MLRVRFQFEPVASLLGTLAARLVAPTELLAPAVSVVAAAIERNFDEEGRPREASGRWAPLAPRYAAGKARRFGAGLRILERTGALRRSVVTRLEGNVLIASTDVSYAAFHQFGTSRIPTRPFLTLAGIDKEEVAQSIAQALEDTGRRPALSAVEGSLATGRSL